MFPFSPPPLLTFASVRSPGTSVIQLTATDADDPTYGNSARVVYSIVEGQPYFSVDAKTGTTALTQNCDQGNQRVFLSMTSIHV